MEKREAREALDALRSGESRPKGTKLYPMGMTDPEHVQLESATVLLSELTDKNFKWTWNLLIYVANEHNRAILILLVWNFVLTLLVLGIIFFVFVK